MSRHGALVHSGPPESGSWHSITRRSDWPAVVTAVIIGAVNVLVITGFQLPFLGPAAGFWFIMILPVYLLCTTSVWRGCTAVERVGYSLTAVLLLLMLAGLAINTFLPLLGMQRPLDPVPVLLVGDILTVSLYLVRRQHPVKTAWRAQFQAFGREGRLLLVGSGLSVAFAILGANRLNNGTGDEVSVAALAGIVITILLLLRWRGRLRDGMISVTLYLLSLALLLMTSLRGWYVTGHDIQVEYRVFQLAQAHGRWNISDLHDAYNACMSITILPTEVAQIVHVDNPYVYKVFFQLMFALCPVLVYAIARRFWSTSIAILAAIYFAGFPTFLNDMPFLNRQEIAFLFVSAAILSITNPVWTLRRRQLGLCVASLGVELSHYSTMYLFLGTLLAAWASGYISWVNPRRWRRPTGVTDANRTSWGVMSRTVGMGSILIMVAIMLGWGGLATHTAGSALTDAESAVYGLVRSNGARSDDVAYSLLPGKTVSPQVALNDYRQETVKQNAGSSPGTYVPASVVARYPTPMVSEPTLLPLTGAGHLLADIGIPAAGFNTLVRQAAAKGEQVFVAIGLCTFALRSRRREIGREFFFLCLGSIVMLVILTILPDLSVDYGVLRAFQEALIVIAPVLVAGSLTLFRPLGKAWGSRTAAVVCIGLFISTAGLLPQILGGYPPQLSLNNSGTYYQMYYVHPQEVTAAAWLAGKPGVLPDGVQADNSQDRFAFTARSDVTGAQFISDNYPSLVRQSSWVILSYSTVQTGQATTFYDGDILTYMYPIDFLQHSKDLVYDDGGAQIYR